MNKKNLIKRLREASKLGLAGAGGYGKRSIQYLCFEAAEYIASLPNPVKRKKSQSFK